MNRVMLQMTKWLVIPCLLVMMILAASGCTDDSSGESTPTGTSLNTPQVTASPSVEPTPSKIPEDVHITVDEVKALMDQGESIFFIDTRSQAQWDGADTMLPGAVHLVPGTLEAHLSEIPHDRTIVFYPRCSCSHDDSESVQEAKNLIAEGWVNVYSLKGGIDAWVSAKLPTEPK